VPVGGRADAQRPSHRRPHHCVVGERDCRGIGRTHKIVERVGYAGIERCARLSPIQFEPLGRRTPHERPSASHFWLYEPLPRTLVQLTETDISLQIHKERGSEGAAVSRARASGLDTTRTGAGAAVSRAATASTASRCSGSIDSFAHPIISPTRFERVPHGARRGSLAGHA
jgi:hypothetical protein